MFRSVRLRFSALTFLVCAVAVLFVSAAFGATEPSVILRLGDENNPGQARINNCEEFARRVSEYSNGDMRIDIYPSGQIGQPNEIIEGLRLGSVDLQVTGPSLVGGVVNAFNILGLPYRFSGIEHLRAFVNSDKFQETMAQPLLNAGIRFLALNDRAPRHVMAIDKVVKTPADMKGFKLRLPNSAASFAIWEELGASPQVVSWNETYSALQQGVVNGCEAQAESLNGIAAFEVCKELSLTYHVIDSECVMISEATYQRLTADQRAIIERAAGETSEWVVDRVQAEDAGYMQQFRDKGVNITEADVASFVETAAPSVKQFTEEIVPGLDEYIRSLDK